MKPYRILIVGAGSVGERHLRNLLNLGQTQVALLRRRDGELRTVKDSTRQYTDWNKAIAEFNPEVVFVTNPTSCHLETAQQAALAGCHVLIEKPLSNQLSGISELVSTLERQGRFGMVAYMLRFHPMLKQVKSWLAEGEQGTLGRPLYAHMAWAEHVPDWHPWEDYAGSYAVQKSLGGGAALTYSHDLDLCLWLFGIPRQVAGWPIQGAPLAGDAESGFDLLLRYHDGFTAHVHADYFTRPAVRQWELVATRGRVIFDYQAGTLTRFDARPGERPTPHGPRELAVQTWHVPQGFDRNDLFVEELRYFFHCLEHGLAPQPNLWDGALAVKLALAARTAQICDFSA